MATAPVVNRKKASADIIPPKFEILLASPTQSGWAGERVGEYWQPLSLVHSDGGEFSTLTIGLTLGSDPRINGDLQANVDLVRVIQAGTRVRLVDRSQEGKEWFVGYVGQDATLIQGSPQAESFQLSVYGPEWLFAGRVVRVKWYANRGFINEWMADTSKTGNIFNDNISVTTERVVFNEGGPNMAPWGFDFLPGGSGIGAEARTFVETNWRATRNGATIGEAKQWTAFAALHSMILAFEFDTYYRPTSGDVTGVISHTQTDWKAIKAVLGTVTIKEVSIDGLTLAQAVQAILGPIGYGFRLDIASDGNSRHGLSVYPLKASVSGKTPYLPPIGSAATDANGSRGEISRIEYLRDAHNIKNEVHVYGNQETVQVALSYKSSQTATDLFPVWSNDSDPITSFFTDGSFKVARVTNPQTLIDNYHTSGVNFHKHRDAWRTFIFNEDAGGLDFGITGEDGIPDLRDYGLGLALFKRPIRRLLVRDAGTNDFRLPIVTMTVTTNGTTFTIDVSEHFEILTDRAGIRLKTDVFSITKDGAAEAWRPFQQKQGSTLPKTAAEEALGNLPYLDMLNNALTSAGDEELVLTVTGTMAGGIAVRGESRQKTNSPLNLVRERLVRSKSLNRFSIQGAALGGEDTRDDSTKALGLANTIQFAGDSEVGHGSIVFHHLTQAYPPGTVISQTAGRPLNFRLDGQRKNSAPVVRKTTHTFGETNTTEVLLDSPLLRLT